jgi:PAS domain S-box-containing protein
LNHQSRDISLKTFSMQSTTEVPPTGKTSVCLSQAGNDLVVHQLEFDPQNNEHHLLTELDCFPVPVAFGCIDKNDCILQANSAVTGLLGVTPSQLFQQDLKRLIHEDDLLVYCAMRKRIMACAEPQSCEMRLRHSGGSFFWIKTVAAASAGCGCDGDGAPVLWAVLIDINGRKQAEAALHANRKFRDAILDSVSSQIAVLDRHGTIVAVNQAWQRFALDNATHPGTPDCKTHIGTNYFHICEQTHGSFSELAMQVHQGIQKVIDGDWPSFSLEYPCHSSTQQRWFELRVTPLSLDECGAVVSHTEVTDRKKLQEARLAFAVEKELARSRQQLRDLVALNEAAREEDRKNLAREMHDELGQVLTLLRMDLSLLGIRFGELDPALLTEVQTMKAQLDRALQSVRNVVIFLRPEALNLGLVPAIEWLCQECARVNHLPCALDAQEDFKLDDARAVVVFRIVQESLTNITRYAKASRVNVHLGWEGRHLRLDVCDNGCGFDVQSVRQKRSFGLLGMRERAMSLGGALEITSTPGQGTVVTLIIPFLNDEASQPP